MPEDDNKSKEVTDLQAWMQKKSSPSQNKEATERTMDKNIFMKMVDNTAEDLRNKDAKQKHVDDKWNKNIWWYIISAVSVLILWLVIRASNLSQPVKFFLGDILCQGILLALLFLIFLRRKWIAKIVKEIRDLSN